MASRRSLRAEVDLALGDTEAAGVRAARLARLGAETGCTVMLARGERARGHALASTDAAQAVHHLGRALETFGRVDLPYEAARTHLLLARAFGPGQHTLAVAEARAAFTAFDELGATPDADAAAAYLRALGVRAARSGPRGAPVLTRREAEVLALVAQGLSNRAIGERLFLSRKTVEHHVRRVLTKLGVGNRTEAAAYAVRQGPPDEGR